MPGRTASCARQTRYSCPCEGRCAALAAGPDFLFLFFFGLTCAHAGARQPGQAKLRARRQLPPNKARLAAWAPLAARADHRAVEA